MATRCESGPRRSPSARPSESNRVRRTQPRPRPQWPSRPPSAASWWHCAVRTRAGASPPGRTGFLLRPDLRARSLARVLAPGSTFAGYEVERVVGAGGIGILYRARQVRLDRPVALKLVEREVARDPVIRERLRREAR